jgi:hypothetical protein
MADATNFIDPLEQELCDLKQSVESGKHNIGGNDLHYLGSSSKTPTPIC